MLRGLGKVQRHFLLCLIVPTEALQEPRWLGILRGLRLCLCILDGADLYPYILLAPHLRSGIFRDFCSGISRGRTSARAFCTGRACFCTGRTCVRASSSAAQAWYSLNKPSAAG
jgi:hypothetical protein